MKPFVARLWDQDILIIAIAGSLVTYVHGDGTLGVVDLNTEGVYITVQYGNSDWPVGYQFHAPEVVAWEPPPADPTLIGTEYRGPA